METKTFCQQREYFTTHQRHHVSLVSWLELLLVREEEEKSPQCSEHRIQTETMNGYIRYKSKCTQTKAHACKCFGTSLQVQLISSHLVYLKQGV